MHNFEKFASLTSLSLYLLKIFSTYNSDVVFFLLMTGLAFFYLVFGFFLVNNIAFVDIFKKESYQTLSVLRGLGSACVGFLMGPLVLSTIFIVFHYEGHLTLYIISVGPTILLLVVSVVKYLLTKDAFYRDLIFRSLFWMAFPSLALLLS